MSVLCVCVWPRSREAAHRTRFVKLSFAILPVDLHSQPAEGPETGTFVHVSVGTCLLERMMFPPSSSRAGVVAFRAASTTAAWGVLGGLAFKQAPSDELTIQTAEALLHMLVHRIAEAASSPPPLFSTMGPLLALAAFSLPFGLCSGFLSLPKLPPAPKLILIGLVTFIAPGVLEEILFRVIALPPDACSFGQAALAWAAFVVYHVDLFHPPLHSDLRFLVMAAALGIAATVAYCTSGGNLWASVIVHWIPVWVWIAVMGGFEAHEADLIRLKL